MYSANVSGYRPGRTDIQVYTVDKLGNPHYSSRLYKILSHIYDPVEWSVYVDADIYLPEGMEQNLIEELKASGKTVGVFKHPWRDCLYQEADEVVRLGKDYAPAVMLQKAHYKQLGFGEHKGLGACGVLVRNNKEAEALNILWWTHVCAFSKRDQISFPYVFDGHIHYYEGNVYDFKRKK